MRKPTISCKNRLSELQKWLAMDFILLLVEAIITTVGCIFIYLIKISV